ncbi:MAG: phosphatase PAP2 family protein [Candidatus Thalassarchaeaceae archaeon]|nr:phosphatase PAP2 family protein [Candidatus Thalassarchaeaceae archaeon]
MKPPNLLLRPFRVFRHTWARRGRHGGKWFILEIFILGLLLVLLPYFSVNHLLNSIGQSAWDPELAIDRLIPVVPWMIIPYVSLYILNPLPIFSHPRNERARMELLMALQAIGTLTVVSCIFFILLPAEVDMRDQLPAEIMGEGGGIIGGMFRIIHTADTPWNAWPSLHMSQSVVLVMIMTRWLNRDWAEYSWSRAALILLWIDVILLFISVLTTKQHYLWDLATGLLMGLFWWWMLSAGFKRLDSMSEDEISAEFDMDTV